MYSGLQRQNAFIVPTLQLWKWFCISLCSPDGENPSQIQASESEYNRPTHKSIIQDSRGKGVGRSTDPLVCDDYVSPPKYKNSLLNRYLNDSLRHVMASEKVLDSRKRNHSGSFSSNEYEDDFLSPSSDAEANFTYRAGKSCPKLSRFKKELN